MPRVRAASSRWLPRCGKVTLADGKVVALVRDPADARHVVASGRKVEVWTLEEVGNLITGFPTLVRAKEIFPGAEVVRVRAIRDPLENWEDGDELPPLNGGRSDHAPLG